METDPMYRMNDLTLVLQKDDGAIGDRLSNYQCPEPREGIREVCHVDPEVKGMSIRVPGSDRTSNFKVYEFTNGSGLVKLHPTVILALQATRDGLREHFHREIGVFITSGFRSEADQRRLAIDQGLGWTSDGGRVSKNSMHKHGCAVDMHAYDFRDGKRVDKMVLKDIAAVFFDYTKSYNATSHIHADMRYTAGILGR